MKLTRLIVFLFAAVVTVSVTAHAQSINSENLRQVKVDELSDSDIQAYYQKATSAGLSETQLYNIAIQRGMPESEIAKLKLALLQVNIVYGCNLIFSPGRRLNILSDLHNGVIVKI